MQQISPMIGSKDALTGRYGSLSSSGLGSERPIYNKATEEDIEYGEEEDFIRDEIKKQIASIIYPHHNTAIGVDQSRRDKASLTSPNHAFLEEAHTTTARNTMSPFSNRQLYPNGLGPIIGTGGSNQAFRTTGNFVGIGTQYGSSRPHKILTDIEDENVWDISKLPDPMERSFFRHNNRVKKVLNLLKEYLSDEINSF